jgi:hypothetical protein
VLIDRTRKTMIRNLFFFLIIFLLTGACSSLEKNEEKLLATTKDIENEKMICFNHSLLVLDSTTYAAAVHSEFLRQFAFSYEKQLPGYEGFYLIGSTNYLEFFHPKSMDGEELKIGEIWICLASLQANFLKKLNTQKLKFINYESDDQFNYLSLVLNDSINPITTWEMRKKQYESWTKKEYHDSIVFLPVDYNSPQESDSSSNYLMKDVVGIGLSLHPDDSSMVISYLKEIGFNSIAKSKEFVRFSNQDQFVELYWSKKKNSPKINRYYIRLNKTVAPRTEIIGHSRIECAGQQAIWYFD